MISAGEALERLKEGNRRFVSNAPGLDTPPNARRPADLAAAEQQPFAIVLGCSDSRVPPEIVFNQGLGDLFVIRVAGNIVTPAQLGSIEVAAARFSTPLVVVLGHSRCGAILATLEALQQQLEIQTPNMRSIFDRVRPSVEGLLKTEHKNDLDALVQHAVRANIVRSVNDLRRGSAILEQMIRNNGLIVAGAEYSLDTGIVEFFDSDQTGQQGYETVI